MEEGNIGPQSFHLYDEQLFPVAVVAFYVLSVATVALLRKMNAPYGRHIQRGWEPLMSARDGWVLMESPALWAMMGIYTYGRNRHDFMPILLLRLHQIHYVNRVLIYPFRMMVEGKGIPIVVVMAAFGFNIFNAYVQARQISQIGTYNPSWLYDPRFLLGFCFFFIGFVINNWADTVLLNLRSSATDRSYRIPCGKFFDLVTCPNYFGEALEWLGWALMTWSWAGLAFFVYTLANLMPRAYANHHWYLKRNSDYPRGRKIMIPFVW